jgi:aminoglycoside phosphotransferase (APT) family kinase protein
MTEAAAPSDPRPTASASVEPDARLRDFLLSQGLAAKDEPMVWTPLAGGVSSDIWRVDVSGRSLCIKRALPQLKVAQIWNAPVERNAFEWAWINFAAQHCPDSVPVPLAVDVSHAIFAMGFLDPDHHPVWKSLLLAGVARAPTASSVGAILARLHAASAHDPAVAARFGTDAIFHAIRLEPYLLATAARHPDLARRLRELAERTAGTRIALVHGDVSPKNILVGPRGPIFLDAECAWYGDPAFDAAFCLNHFLLKCVARLQAVPDYLACYRAFSAAYRRGVSWEDVDGLEARIASLLPALFLARIDGKSPVEYIIDERDKQMVRDAARAMIATAPTTLEQVLEVWATALSKPTT